jgi:hypothetical protein
MAGRLEIHKREDPSYPIRPVPASATGGFLGRGKRLVRVRTLRAAPTGAAKGRLHPHQIPAVALNRPHIGQSGAATLKGPSRRLSGGPYEGCRAWAIVFIVFSGSENFFVTLR